MSSFEAALYSAQTLPTAVDNRLEKRLGILILVVLFLVFFEDFLRMVFSVGGTRWLLLKDSLLVGLYIGMLAWWAVASRIVSWPRVATPLVVYFFVTALVYSYSAIVHWNVAVTMIGARVDMFYVPLALIMVYAVQWAQLPKVLFRLFVFVATINIGVSIVQFFFPEILANIPGFSGLREEGTVLHEYRSFHDLMISTIFGLFSGFGKLTRNLFHIFIWLWILHLVFDIGRIRWVFLLSILIGFILIVSGKRLPPILWGFCMASIPVFTQVAYLLSRSASPLSHWGRWSVRSIRNKSGTLLVGVLFSAILMAGFSSKAQIYVDMLSYVILHEVEERFMGDSDQYFWQAEVNKISQDKAVFGQGAGTSTMGIHYVMTEQEFASAGFRTVEHGPLKVWLELGLLGMIQLSLLWGGLFVIDMMSIIRVKRQPRWLVASLIISLYHLSTLASFFVGHQYWDDVQLQIHFWLITGMQLYLWRWGRIESVVRYATVFHEHPVDWKFR